MHSNTGTRSHTSAITQRDNVVQKQRPPPLPIHSSTDKSAAGTVTHTGTRDLPSNTNWSTGRHTKHHKHRLPQPDGTHVRPHPSKA